MTSLYRERKSPVTGSLIGILRLSDDAFIPIAPGNRDYQEYMDWVAEGNNPDPDPYFTVAAARERAWTNVKAERDSRKSGGVLVGGNWFHSDDGSRIQWLGIKDSARDILLAGGTNEDIVQILGQNLIWKTLSNTYVPVTVKLGLDVTQATKDLDARLFAYAEQLRAQINASDDPLSINVSQGWPQSYQDTLA